MYASADVQTAIAEIAGHGVKPFAITGRFENVSPSSFWISPKGRTYLLRDHYSTHKTGSVCA